MPKTGITISLTVDRDRWAQEYGLEPRSCDVRADLLAYITNALANLPVPVEVTRR